MVGVLVKYQDAANKKPNTKELNNLVIVWNALYVLPLKLLVKCVEILHYRNTNNHSVVLDGTDKTSQATRPDAGAKVELDQINGIEAYTRDTIEVVISLTNFMAQVELGFMLVKWLLKDALPFQLSIKQC
ncbi:hypothetical protein BBJ28_00020437 [Nothophytophthora sp. Chile5]|nr:hypothetical protein BBJ28_00020437 [Nothophytophthora sp. Chile5]